MQQYTQSNNVRIFGIRDTRKDEQNLIGQKLDFKLHDRDIDIAHRLGSFRPNSDRCIIVRFSSRKTIKTIMTKRRALKGSGITIAEDLTKINFNRLRQLKDLDAVERAWTKKGEAYAVGRNGKILKYNPMQSLSDFNEKMKAGHGTPQFERHSKETTRPRHAEERPPPKFDTADQDLSVIFPTRQPRNQNNQRSSSEPRQSTPNSQLHQSNNSREDGENSRTPVQNTLIDLAK
ncbi:hypothetical protein ElyMa_001505800 [Elysia marginata]|uniref:Uncharacterized protein n=1 Tax=Elysia marginata TaxID=1093978 RepID=A0AAV4J6A7_9GAST|nr:hypothetical protein ElyMa_001505800 [Elysia marginata]